MSDGVERRARIIKIDLLRQGRILKCTKPTERAAAPQKQNRRERIYFPRDIVETVLALSRGRTRLFFGERHRCKAHDKLLDDVHLVTWTDCVPRTSETGRQKTDGRWRRGFSF